MLATVEDGVEACLHIFLQYVLPTKFPEGLSTEEEWKAFLEYISPNGESLDEEATGAGLVKLVSGRFLERFQIQLSVADGKARFHQIKTDVEKGDLRLLGIAPAAASVFCRKANESEAEYQSRVRKRVTDKHVAESKTTAVGLFDLLLTAIENRFQNEDGFETDSLPKDVNRSLDESDAVIWTVSLLACITLEQHQRQDNIIHHALLLEMMMELQNFG